MSNAFPHALVTGASSGIGLAITERLLANGWRVSGVARRAIPLKHPELIHLALDLEDPSTATQILERATGVTAFIHAAGFLVPAPLGALDMDAGMRMWRLHVDAPARIANELVPLLPQGGRIILIGSRTSVGSPGKSQYAATKAALESMTRSWASELVKRGITVNLVAPGATATAMLDDPQRKSMQPKLPPLGRYIKPQEIAAAVVYLLSPDADAMTGQTLTLCGGASLPN
ncbi:MAG: SDR family oxidoreductase [Hyphomicrobiales bacterium]|nr:SDR family oxidoreductase [Hyphomicrobiales bacterium]MDE2115290.1 SDR family oxidoreductase [Hyphomicrobiales bacterium]